MSTTRDQITIRGSHYLPAYDVERLSDADAYTNATKAEVPAPAYYPDGGRTVRWVGKVGPAWGHTRRITIMHPPPKGTRPTLSPPPVTHCSDCGKPFASDGVSDLCPSCVREIIDSMKPQPDTITLDVETAYAIVA